MRFFFFIPSYFIIAHGPWFTFSVKNIASLAPVDIGFNIIPFVFFKLEKTLVGVQFGIATIAVNIIFRRKRLEEEYVLNPQETK